MKNVYQDEMRYLTGVIKQNQAAIKMLKQHQKIITQISFIMDNKFYSQSMYTDSRRIRLNYNFNSLSELDLIQQIIIPLSEYLKRQKFKEEKLSRTANDYSGSLIYTKCFKKDSLNILFSFSILESPDCVILEYETTTKKYKITCKGE